MARDEDRQYGAVPSQRAGVLLKGVPDCIFLLDDEGTFLDAHAADLSMLACPIEDVLGRHVGDVLGPEFWLAARPYITRTLKTGSIQVWEYQLAISGQDRDFEARFKRCGDAQVSVTIREVTQELRLESEIAALGESERTHEGRELHEGLAQQLVGIKLLLQSLSYAIGPQHKQNIQVALELLGESVRQSRELAFHLVPMQGGATLTDGLAQLARHCSERGGTEVECPCPLSPTG